MEVMDFETQIQILALREVMKVTTGWYQRHIYRWYSTKFATPLHTVPQIPYADVLLAYYEDHYEGMDAEEREEQRKALIETEDQWKARVAEEEAQQSLDFDFEKFADAEAKRLENTPIPEQKALRPIAHPHKEAPEALMPEAKNIPADVKIKFVDEGFFDELMDKLDHG